MQSSLLRPYILWGIIMVLGILMITVGYYIFPTIVNAATGLLNTETTGCSIGQTTVQEVEYDDLYEGYTFAAVNSTPCECAIENIVVSSSDDNDTPFVNNTILCNTTEEFSVWDVGGFDMRDNSTRDLSITTYPCCTGCNSHYIAWCPIVRIGPPLFLLGFTISGLGLMLGGAAGLYRTSKRGSDS